MNFQEQFYELRKQAIQVIKDKLVNGPIQFISEEDIDEQTDEFAELPIMFLSGDGDYKEYRVCKVSLDERGEIEFHCDGYCEMIGKQETVSQDYMLSEEILRVADIIVNY